MGDTRGIDVTDPNEPTSHEGRVLIQQQAPIITIDTSAVSFPQNIAAPWQEPSSASTLLSISQRRRSLSIENKPLLSVDLRPASSHNNSTLTTRGDDHSTDSHNLLAVPYTRSRGSSLDQQSLSSYDGDTLVRTPTMSDYDGSNRKPAKAMFFHELGHDHPLRPDPGEEPRFHVEDNPFAFSPGQLSKLFNPKSLRAFCALGGLQGLVLGLRTDSSSGLSVDETTLDGTVDFDNVTEAASSIFPQNVLSLGPRLHSTASAPIRHTSSELYMDRKRVFGMNRLPEKKSKSLLQIMWMTFNDKVLIILTIVAAISLALGLYQDFGQSARNGGPKVRWVEGVTIMVAVAIVVVVGSLNDYQKEQQFIKLNTKVGNFPCLKRSD
jgi:Ca2+-transporting ATPase